MFELRPKDELAGARLRLGVSHFSVCPGTCGVDTTWMFVRNAWSRAGPQTC